MKVLFLGEIGEGQTSLMRMQALERLGHSVRGVNTVEAWKRMSWFKRQLQRRLQTGPTIDLINRFVTDAAREFRPDLIWAEKQEFLYSDTIRKIKKIGTRIVHFTPDPYFALSWKRTRLMDDALTEFDALIYCKSYERPEYESLRKPLIYMPLGYCDIVHRPLPSGDPRWTCSAGFLGGWEPRRELLLHAVAAAGVDLKIWGGYWDFLLDGRCTPRRFVIQRQLAGGDPFKFHKDDILAQAYVGGEVYADDYARALTGSKIGFGLLRKVCPDQHTTRTFEIPACGSMLLADRTDEHRAFFTEGSEAEFFESVEELLDKVVFYVNHETSRAKIARQGYLRCISSNYAYLHRMRDALDKLSRL
jgi:hypothetical protein